MNARVGPISSEALVLTPSAMASSRPSSTVDESGRTNQQSFLDLHNILNPIRPNSSGGVSQLGPDVRKRPSLDAERANPSQENRIYPFSEVT